MHAAAEHQGSGWIWLIAGTGEGPPLAAELLARGWLVRIFVVSAAAARAYRPQRGLEIAVGDLGDAGAIAAKLEQASQVGTAPRWLIDATHPFATRISDALLAAAGRREQPLLRLRRPLQELGSATLLADLEALGHRPLAGRRLLLAIGARQLELAVSRSPGALHHARILPHPAALAAALAAGLADDRVAPLRPGGSGDIERALCRRWGIEAVLCRRSGGVSEALWQRLATEEGLALLLLERPREAAAGRALALPELLERIGTP